VTARIVLPVTAMAAGSTLSGTVIVENSGAEFQVTSCGDYFKLFLTNEHGLNKEAPRRLCDTTSMTIPTGTSSYPVTLSASYEYCDEVTGTGYFECLPDGSPEPLPADDYRAVLLQASNPPVPIVADPVAVTVTNG